MTAPSALRALAQQATPGRSIAEDPGSFTWDVMYDAPGFLCMGIDEKDARFVAACDPETILALLDAVEAATDLITNAADSSRDVKLEARRRLIAALAPFTETQT